MSTPAALNLAAQAAAQGVPRHILRQSLFFAFCPDQPDALERRMKVRAQHWARASEDKKEGILFFGLGYLPPAGSPLFNSPLVPAGKQPMAGSFMIMRQPDMDAMWKRIKDDVYWTAGVWDRETTQVGEFIREGGYVDLGED